MPWRPSPLPIVGRSQQASCRVAFAEKKPQDRPAVCDIPYARGHHQCSMRRRRSTESSDKRSAALLPRLSVCYLLVGTAVLIEEVVHFTFRFFASAAIPLLNQTGQALGVAFDLSEFVVGQVSPGCLSLALKLLPLAFHCVFIHIVTPLIAA